MFTGIVEALGQIRSIRIQQGDSRLHIGTGALDMGDVRLGDSIATNGVCLTVVELSGDGFWADVSRETLSHSTLARLSVGAQVNLEKALQLSARLGGHLVSGHVDGVGELVERYDDARSIRLKIRAPGELARYIAHKGSICVDGVSLTVNGVAGALFELNIVPHTVRETIIDTYRLGSVVNLEVDLIARYLERLLLAGQLAEQAPDPQHSSAAGGIDLALLAQHGFGNKA